VNSFRNCLLIFLALTTIAGGALAWKQYLAIVALRANGVGSAERDAWQKKIADAQKRQQELEDELAALRAKARANDAALPDSSDDPSSRHQSRHFAGMRELMNDPKFAQLVTLQQKAQLNNSYAPLFKQLAQQLGLTPAQLSAFQNLLAEKQASARDAFLAARDQGLDPFADRAAINQVVNQSNADIDAQIRQTLGDAGYAQYQQYEQTLPERNTANQLQQNLIGLGAPLTDAQYQQLLQDLASNASHGYNPTGFHALFGGNSSAPITDKDIADAYGFLTPEQIAPLINQKTLQDYNNQIFNAARQGGVSPPVVTIKATSPGTSRSP
jgi:hypothetical protein